MKTYDMLNLNGKVRMMRTMHARGLFDYAIEQLELDVEKTEESEESEGGGGGDSVPEPQ